MGNSRSLTQTTTEENEANDALQLGSECLKGEKMVANETRFVSKELLKIVKRLKFNFEEIKV